MRYQETMIMFKPTHQRLTLTAVALSTFVVPPAAGQVINQDLKLTAPDAAATDWFGYSTDVDNGVIAVGSPSDDDNGGLSGSAYLFDAATGALLFKLLPGDGASGDNFGKTIAISDGIVVIGAPGDDDNRHNSGSAYLFEVTTGEQIAKLLPNDGVENDFFASSIAIDKGVVAIGSANSDHNGSNSGSAYLFDASTGAQLFKLLPNDGSAFDFFGGSIAIDNGTVVVGATGSDNKANNSGSVYLFDASTGTQIAELNAIDGLVNYKFGYSVAIDNGVVAVGAIWDDGNEPSSGSAYLFNVSTGEQIVKLLPDDGLTGDLFGFSIGIDNGLVAVGAPSDRDFNFRSG